MQTNSHRKVSIGVFLCNGESMLPAPVPLKYIIQKRIKTGETGPLHYTDTLTTSLVLRPPTHLLVQGPKNTQSTISVAFDITHPGFDTGYP